MRLSVVMHQTRKYGKAYAMLALGKALSPDTAFDRESARSFEAKLMDEDTLEADGRRSNEMGM